MKEHHYNLLVVVLTGVQVVLASNGYYRYDYIFCFFGVEALIHKHMVKHLNHLYHTKHNKKGSK